MRKNKAEVSFTPNERRILQFGMKEKVTGPEARAVRKILDTFPWIIEVAEHKFNKRIADGYLITAAKWNQAADELRNLIKDETEKINQDSSTIDSKRDAAEGEK